MKIKTREMIAGSLMAAICFVITRFLMVPALYTEGYVNLGDSAVLLCALVPGGLLGFLAAGIGSALADLASGFAIYIPATFIIKGIMVLILYYSAIKQNTDEKIKLHRLIIGCICAELFMVAGYFIYEYVLYGAGAVASVVGNLIQGSVNCVLSVVLISFIDCNKALKNMIKTK